MHICRALAQQCDKWFPWQYNISYPFLFGSDPRLILPNGQLAFTKYADINTVDVNCSDFERKSDSRVCDSLATLAELEKMSKDFTLSCKPLAWEYRRHFATLPPPVPPPPVVSPRNNVLEMRAEIPYWWRVTTQIWEVFLIGWSRFPTRHVYFLPPPPLPPCVGCR